MLPPDKDIEARVPLWNAMQMFWMDQDPDDYLPGIADLCAASAYSMQEIGDIFWNEVRPAVSFNLLLYPAPEWAGFEESWLRARVLKTHRFGRRRPRAWLDFYSHRLWRRLSAGIAARRSAVD